MLANKTKMIRRHMQLACSETMNTPRNDERANVDANNRLASKLTLGSSQANSVDNLATKQQYVVYHYLVSTRQFHLLFPKKSCK